MISFSSAETKFLQNQHFLKTRAQWWNAKYSEWMHFFFFFLSPSKLSFWETLSLLFLLNFHLSNKITSYTSPQRLNQTCVHDPRWVNWGNIFFFCIIDCKLETSMEPYCCQMQKPNNEVKQRRDVQIDEERMRRKKRDWRREEGGGESGIGIN